MWSQQWWKQDITQSDQLCLTPFCIKADETIEPCDDFFQFACGSWLKSSKIPEDSGAQDTFNILKTELDNNIVSLLTSLGNDSEPEAIKNARNMYQSCVDEAAIENDGTDTLLTLINNELNGWPILLGDNWNNSTFNLLKILLKLREYNNNIIFSIATTTDDKNSSAYCIRIAQSDIALEQRTYYNDANVTEPYQEFMRDLALSLSNLSLTDTTKINADVKDIFQFESNLAKYHLTNAEQQRARQNETIRTTVGNLSRDFNTTFNFTAYLYNSYEFGNVTLKNDDVVSINDLPFLRNATELLQNYPSRTIANYIIWRFMINRASNMPKYYRAIKDKFERVFRGTSAEKSRSTQCGNYVNINMGFAVSKLYIKQYFDESARNQSLEMIGYIRDAFISILNETMWMDKDSKLKAVEKARAIDGKIGYPDWLGSNNITQLEEDYADYKFNLSYIKNVLQMLKTKSKENIHVLREPVDRKAWAGSAPTVVNAFYTPSKNQITFPAGILQFPFYNKDAPKYLNYGGIGTVIGHEISHGFDDNGRQYDKDGNKKQWWSEDTIKQFNDRKKCIVDQYSNYTISQINRTAYKKWSKLNDNSDKKLPGLKYSPEQMFFVNYAQVWCSKMTDSYATNRVLTGVHATGQFRVLGPTSNFIEFDRVFKCKRGQGNSRVQKCSVW
ncbi:unnamed protein product [Didymodactylos carnosus]|uniref:Uncharacterized protein n=1 Tax=Didymodactylos carnosus TaxID=1234261 RepID=A0A814R3N6_9BILA|nr:unnamed protein product [Didymodactylos carnosus]CAF1176925.1 unnamed protein product [Didymodactylos carnosus]CAF3891561.1 unnamed protein product [Didymodactylos carnosus]CAF3988034.1 unnamed protein product [Didymodactylos carnosus]